MTTPGLLFPKIFLLLVLLPWAFTCLGQPFLRHALRTDLVALSQGNIGLAYEWQPSRRNGLELYFESAHHERLPDEVFHGDQIANYTQRSVDTIDPLYQVQLDQTTWRYLGTGRALTRFPEHISLSTLGFRAGYRFYFQKKNSLWRFFLQPGAALRRHRFFEIRDAIYSTRYQEDSWVLDLSPYDLKVVQRTYDFRQTRSMRSRESWHWGFTYDVGVARRFWRHLLLEARATGGINFSTPYKAGPPALLRNTYLRPSLQLGWAFGSGKRRQAASLPTW